MKNCAQSGDQGSVFPKVTRHTFSSKWAVGDDCNAQTTARLPQLILRQPRVHFDLQGYEIVARSASEPKESSVQMRTR